MASGDELTAEKALAMTYTDYVAVEKVVSAPLPVAFEKFHDYVWLRNGGSFISIETNRRFDWQVEGLT